MVKTMVKAVVKPVKMFPESESIEINDVLIVFSGYYNPPRPNGTRSVCFPATCKRPSSSIDVYNIFTSR